EQLELLLLELVQVRDVGDELRLEQRPHPLVPETTDVHRPATREVHDALEDPPRARHVRAIDHHFVLRTLHLRTAHWTLVRRLEALRSEEHTSELQSPCNLVCRLLLEKKNKTQN